MAVEKSKNTMFRLLSQFTKPEKSEVLDHSLLFKGSFRKEWWPIQYEYKDTLRWIIQADTPFIMKATCSTVPNREDSVYCWSYAAGAWSWCQNMLHLRQITLTLGEGPPGWRQPKLIPSSISHVRKVPTWGIRTRQRSTYLTSLEAMRSDRLSALKSVQNVTTRLPGQRFSRLYHWDEIHGIWYGLQSW